MRKTAKKNPVQPELRATEVIGHLGRLLFHQRVILFALMGAIAFQAILEPAYAWLAQQLVKVLETSNATDLLAVQGWNNSLDGLLAAWNLNQGFAKLVAVWLQLQQTLLDLWGRFAGSPLFGLIMAWLGVSLTLNLGKFAAKLLQNLYKIRLVIELQRDYFRHGNRDSGHNVGHTTHMLYGSKEGCKALEVVYKDGWEIIIRVISVLFWQMHLGMEWLPLLVIACMPTAVMLGWLGAKMRGVSAEILNQQHCIAKEGRPERQRALHTWQERWFRSEIRSEVLKWFIEDGLDMVLWTIVGLLLLLSLFMQLPLIPDTLELSGLTAFLINVKLMAKPLNDVGKVYAKWQEAYPAFVNTVRA
jgi:ABC-type multidrug transport system fused ATPase/permease subunit